MQYKAFSNKQMKLLTWWLPNSPFSKYNGIIAEGAIRSGKTVICGISFIMWSMENFNKKNFALCGKTIGSLRRNVVEPLTEMLIQRGFNVVDRKVEGKLIVSRNKRINTYYLFGGRDESSAGLVQGVTLAGCLLDEVALMPRSFVEQVLGRCSVDGSKFWFNCNPDSPMHWFYNEWILKAREHECLVLHFNLEDNPSLSEEITERYKSMYTGIFYKRFILGEWAFADGIVYDMITDDNFYNEQTRERIVPINIREGDVMPIYGVDFGTANPQVYLEVYKSYKADSNIPYFYVDREWYWDGRKQMHQKTPEQYVREVTEWRKERYKYFVIDPSATPLKAAHRNNGDMFINAKNEVNEGIAELSTLFAMNHVLINKTQCPHLCNELGIYKWNDKRLLNGKEEVLKENDHCCDALRYAIHTTTPISTVIGRY